MGAWGTNSDQNDNVADEWIDIEISTLPQTMKIKLNKMKDIAVANRLRRKYVSNNQQKLYKSLKKEINAQKKMREQADPEDKWIYERSIAGLALKAVRVLQDLPQSDPLGAGIFPVPFPKKLPKGFPEWLRKDALESILSLYETYTHEGWRDPEKRKKSLEKELKLFSN